jgi:putative methanogenesis marker protein 5
MTEVEKRVTSRSEDLPPYNITSGEPRSVLEHCAVEVPSGVRGRVAVLLTLIDEADAAILITDPDYAFGSAGCARANELVRHMIYERNIPILSLKQPKNLAEAEEFIQKIAGFLKKIEDNRG